MRTLNGHGNVMINGHGNVVAASVHLAVAAIAVKTLAKVRAFLTRTDFGWDQTVSIRVTWSWNTECRFPTTLTHVSQIYPNFSLFWPCLYGDFRRNFDIIL